MYNDETGTLGTTTMQRSVIKFVILSTTDFWFKRIYPEHNGLTDRTDFVS